jgi:dTDP-4-amino-4,6-dideoxygalactose transaminase
MHQLPIYRKEVCLPHAEYLSQHGIVLPTYSGLQDEEVDEICHALKTCLSELSG